MMLDTGSGHADLRRIFRFTSVNRRRQGCVVDVARADEPLAEDEETGGEEEAVAGGVGAGVPMRLVAAPVSTHSPSVARLAAVARQNPTGQ